MLCNKCKALPLLKLIWRMHPHKIGEINGIWLKERKGKDRNEGMQYTMREGFEIYEKNNID